MDAAINLNDSAGDPTGLGTAASPEPTRVAVLLVDDQAIIGEAIRRALASEADISFRYCADGNRAIEVAREAQPTVILQDLVMPGIDGMTLVKQYRADPATHDVPIIVMSTKDDATIKSAAFTAGANDYLVKVPDAVELIARIRYHSRSYLNLVQRNEAYKALRQSQQRLLEINLELQRMTNQDGMTGLANRRYFDEYVSGEWKRGQRTQTPLSLMMVDVDDFKKYNDTYGHVAGDDVLRRVARAIKDCCERPGDLAARFGGEEFVVVLPSTSPAGARLLGENLRRAVEQLGIAHEKSTHHGTVTTSIGVATIVPTLEKSPTWLIERADQALYNAKHGGKNRVCAAD